MPTSRIRHDNCRKFSTCRNFSTASLNYSTIALTIVQQHVHVQLGAPLSTAATLSHCIFMQTMYGSKEAGVASSAVDAPLGTCV